MVEARQGLGELGLDAVELVQRQRALIELAISDARAHQPVDQGANPLGRGILQGAGRRFDRVGEHDDRRLPGLRLRTRIGKVPQVDVEVRLLLSSLVQEVRDRLRAVVLADEVLDGGGQTRLLGQPESLPHVLLDHLRTSRRMQTVVGVPSARLILHEVLRLLRLADVVVIRAHPSEQCVGTDRRAGGLREVRHADRVRVRARGLLRELPEKRAIQVRELQQGLVGGDAREALQSGQQPPDHQDRAQRRVQGAQGRRGQELTGRQREQEDESELGDDVGARDHRDEDPAVGPPPEAADAGRGRRTRSQRQEHRAETGERRLSGEQRRDDHDRYESEQAVIQGADQQGGDGHGDESGGQIGTRHNAGQHQHDEDQTHHDREAALVLVHLSSPVQIEHAAEDEEQDKGVQHPARGPQEGARSAREALIDQRRAVGPQLLDLLASHPLVSGNDPFALQDEARRLLHGVARLPPGARRRCLIQREAGLQVVDHERLKQLQAVDREGGRSDRGSLRVEAGDVRQRVATNEPVSALLSHDHLRREDVGKVPARHHPPRQQPLVRADQSVPQRPPPAADLEIRRLLHRRHGHALDLAEHQPDRERIVVRDGQRAVQPGKQTAYPTGRALDRFRVEAEDRGDATLRLASLQLKAFRRFRHVERDLGDDVLRSDLSQLQERGIRQWRPGEQDRHQERDPEQEKAAAAVMQEVGSPARAGGSPDRANRLPPALGVLGGHSPTSVWSSRAPYARMISFTRRCLTTSLSSR